MNLLKEIVLTIFSFLLIILAVVYSVILIGWADVDFLLNINEEVLNNLHLRYTILGINALIIILALISVFGGSGKKDAKRTGILLENEKGKLLISKQTLENLVNSVVSGFENVNMNAVRIDLDEESKLNVNISICVGESVVIKELSNAIQNQIKETIKKASDLEVKNVNVSIRGIIENKKVGN